MSESASNSKRLAKNTLFLYFRMLLVMGVTLYTTRILLSTLGIVDYGIYNVVGGIVAMFTFLAGTMSSASQRFFSYELGQKNNIKLQHIFSVSLQIYIIISLIVLLIAETLGLWILNTQLSIPADRMDAARFVYQFSIFSFIITIMATPYNAAIIAQEDMKIYAYVSIVEVVAKLGIVYMLTLFSYDYLKTYSVLFFIVTFIVQGLYVVYCRKNYDTYRFNFYWDKQIFSEMFVFAGWNMIGALANILRSQGINILLNMFFNPVVNAARAIAYQINSAINTFVNNFYTAVRPQIFKTYSAGEFDVMHDIVLKSAKYAYFLMLVITVPLWSELEFWLAIWLNEVPDNTILFSKIIIVNALLEVFSFPLVNAMQATGNIKIYQITVSVLYLLNIPISYVFLKLGYPPETTMYVNVALVILSFIPRLILCNKIAGLSTKQFFDKVIFRVLICTLFSLIFIFFVSSIKNIILRLFINEIATILVIIFVGISKGEKSYIWGKIKTFI